MNPSPLDLLTFILATYYLAITATKLHGPYAVAERWRHWVYRRRGFDPMPMPSGEIEWFRYGKKGPDGPAYDPPPDRIGDDWIAAGVTCPLCASLYAGALVAALSMVGLPGALIVYSLALAGGASLLFTLGRTW